MDHNDPYNGVADAVETYSRNTANTYLANTNLLLVWNANKGLFGFDFSINRVTQEIELNIVPTKAGGFDWKAEPVKTYTASYRYSSPLDMTGSLLDEATNWLNGK